MNKIDKLKVFRTELAYIQDDDIRNFASKAVEDLPDYFFRVAASSTGKYHPDYALGAGGLVRHTKAAVTIANDLSSLEMYGKFTQDEKDLIIVALILHDGLKHGLIKSEYSVADHPLVAADWVRGNKKINGLISQEYIDLLHGMMASHMGSWNKDYKTGEEILPKPITSLQKFVHQCDYLASRKYLIFDFGDSYYNPDEYDSVQTLAESIESIITKCKDKIKDGVDKEAIYNILSKNNDGKKNPNSIKDIETANKILKELGELNG